MKTCFNTITCGGEKPLEDTIGFMGKYGYEGIEIESSRLDDYLTRYTMEDLKRLLAGNNINVAALMAFPFFAFDEDQRNAHLARVDHYAGIAAELGSDTLLCFICDAPPPEMGIADAIAAAGRAAQQYGETSGKYGVKCALEPIGMTSFMPGPRQAMAVAGASGSRFVGIMMDTFHYFKSGVNFEDIRSIPKESLLIVHVNDSIDLPLEQLNDSHRVYTGRGIIPLVEELKILKNEIGYNGYLSIEIFNQEYWKDDHENVIKNAKASLDEILAKLS